MLNHGVMKSNYIIQNKQKLVRIVAFFNIFAIHVNVWLHR